MPSETVLVRVKSLKQMRVLQELAYEIFPYTYQSILSEPQIAYMLNKMYAEEVLIAQMAEDVQFYLVQQQTQNVGYLSIEFNFPEPNILYIHKIYVHPNCQGKGLGKWMLQQIEQMDFSHSMNAIALNVNRFNKAKAFYLKQGYTIQEEEDIAIGNGYFMNDYVMTKAL